MFLNRPAIGRSSASLKRKYRGDVTCFGSNCSSSSGSSSSSSIGNSLLLPPGGAALSQPRRHSWEEALPPGNSFSLPAGHASARGLFGSSFTEGFSRGSLLNGESGQPLDTSNENTEASGSLVLGASSSEKN